MNERHGLVLLGMITSVIASAAFLFVVTGLTLSVSVLPGMITIHLLSMLIVGAGIGFTAGQLGAHKVSVVVGAIYGWSAGTFTSGYLLATLGLETRVLSVLLLWMVAETVGGLFLGLIPALIFRRPRSR